MRKREQADLRQLARDELIRYQRAELMIKHHNEKIMMLKVKIQSATRAPKHDIVQIQPNKWGKEALLVTLAQMTTDHEEQKRKAINTRMELHNNIGEITNELYQIILRDYWIYGLTIRHIAKSIGYSEQHTRRLHSQALDQYADQYCKNKRPLL